MAEALVQIGLIKTSSEPPTRDFPQGRTVETLTVFVDPTCAHVEDAARSQCVSFLTNDGFERMMLDEKKRELEARERDLSQKILDLQNAQREVREERQQIVSEFVGYDECAGRR
jgi:hypothetical protein